MVNHCVICKRKLIKQNKIVRSRIPLYIYLILYALLLIYYGLPKNYLMIICGILLIIIDITCFTIFYHDSLIICQCNLDNDLLTIPKKYCPICLVELDNLPYRTICNNGHAFHNKCIDVWLLENDTCPLCRMKITK
ncbi:MAG: putative RING finger protein 122-like protein [Edafosvirus sp.]|uniref:Putative RING finger protein 122-like protein n=1 Tax=Edafosvirus sp. TaxID=2487765 RepID=A0A3G4ZSQ8_9VIRU|nr:MAG: putative RING finger protein 122-like protein [Edafosvirus sp.]